MDPSSAGEIEENGSTEADTGAEFSKIEIRYRQNKERNHNWRKEGRNRQNNGNHSPSNLQIISGEIGQKGGRDEFGGEYQKNLGCCPGSEIQAFRVRIALQKSNKT